MAGFRQKLAKASQAAQSLLCVGLDPDPKLMAIPDILDFNRAVVDATKDLVCAYKPNMAFYEAQGSAGIIALEATVAYIRDQAPDGIVLGDGKRGDIGSTAEGYAEAYLSAAAPVSVDALTVQPYLGRDSLQPFLDRCESNGRGNSRRVGCKHPKRASRRHPNQGPNNSPGSPNQPHPAKSTALSCR